jgi:hypothetical protein
MAIFITFSEVWEVGKNPCLFFKRTTMKRSTMVLVMTSALREYYESKAGVQEEAKLDQGMDFVLSKIEEAGLGDIVEWDPEE